jgi:hypothetical protein
MRALSIALLLAACRDGYQIRPDSYARLTALFVDEQERAAVRARNEDDDRDTWVRASSLTQVRTDQQRVHALAQRRWRVAAGVAALLALGTLGVVAGSVLAAPATCTPDHSSCLLSQFAGGSVFVIGAAALAAGTALGAIYLRKPDAEVKAGRGDLTYVE